MDNKMYGMKFNANNSEYLSTISTFNPPANCSISFWVYNTADSQAGYILVLSGNWSVFMGWFDNKLNNDMYWNGTTLESNTELDVNELFHVVLTRASNSNRQIFINGALDNSDSAGGGSPTAATLYVSRDVDGFSYFDGYLDDIRIYNRVLSLAEIETIYACKGVDRINYGLLHRYLLNEGPENSLATGTGSIKDLGLIQNNMTPNNSPTYTGSWLKTRRYVDL